MLLPLEVYLYIEPRSRRSLSLNSCLPTPIFVLLHFIHITYSPTLDHDVSRTVELLREAEYRKS